MKLNLGCGFNKKKDFLNVDKFEGAQPDLVYDLTQTPWPWEDSSVDEVHFDFSLEQMGDKPQDLLNIMKELYRVCEPHAKIQLLYFHPRHDQFYLNPLCVHRLSPEFLQLFSVQYNLKMIPAGSHDDNLGLMLGVNFEITSMKPHVDMMFQEDFETGRITEPEIFQRMRFENNICHVVHIEMKVVKEKKHA